MDSVTDQTFQKELARHGNSTHLITIVDYWAPWCAPCKQLEKVLANIEAEFGYPVLKVNIDENPVLAQGRTSVPQLEFYRQGELLKTHIGALSLRQLKNLLDSF